eukprot:11548441-Ditylum_brightwellii.AAC.1
MQKIINKEDRNCYLIPFPCWMVRLIPHIHVIPQGLIVKPCKNDRLVFNGSIKLDWNSKPVLWDNDATGAFRQYKLHPDIVQMFIFILQQLIFIPCGQTFSSNTSPSNWEPVRRAGNFWQDGYSPIHLW